jgi:hypothetical protein
MALGMGRSPCTLITNKACPVRHGASVLRIVFVLLRAKALACSRAARVLHDRGHGGQDRFTGPSRHSSAETASAVRRVR